MTIHWVGYLWTFLAVFLAVIVYRMAGQKGQI